MDHVAIMRKSWRLTAKVLSGEKTIESRWYMTRRAPWGKISAGDTVYFKDSGSPIAVKTTVASVLQIETTPRRVKELIAEYGEGIGRSGLYERFKEKRYCILIFLKAPTAIKPFDIDKRGFGNMSAWITVDDVTRIML